MALSLAAVDADAVLALLNRIVRNYDCPWRDMHEYYGK